MSRRALLIAAALVLTIAALSYATAFVRGIASAAVKEVVSQVQKQSDSRLRMSEIVVRLPDKVALQNVTLWFGPGAEPVKDALPDFSAKEIVITYGLRQAVLDFLQGKSPSLSGLGSITLVEPRVRVSKKADGTWNFDKLLAGLGLKDPKKNPTGTTAFRGSIAIKDGNLVVVAPELKALGGTALGKPAGEPGSTDSVTVERLACEVYFTRYPLVVGSASGRHVESGMGLSLDASYETVKGKLQGSLAVSSVDVGFLSDLGISRVGGVELTSGKIDAVIRVDGDLTEGFRIWIDGASKGTPTSYRPPGAGSTNEASAGPGHSTGPLTQVKEPFLSIREFTALADATFRATGEVRPGEGGDGLALSIRDWSGQAVLRGGVLRCAGLADPVEEISGRVRFTGSELSLLDLTGRYGDCGVRVSGKVGLRATPATLGGVAAGAPGTSRVDLAVRLSGADLAEVTELSGVASLGGIQMSGKADVTVRVKGDMVSPDISGDAQVSEARVTYRALPRPYEHVDAKVSFDRRVLTIREASGRLGGSLASVSGVIKLDKPPVVALRIRSGSVSTSDTGPIVVGAPGAAQLTMEGTFRNMDVTVAGPTTGLDYSGSVGLASGTLTFSDPEAVIRDVEAEVAFGPDRVAISTGTGTLDGTRLSATGKVGYRTTRSLDLAISSDDFGFELLGRFFPSLVSSGVEVRGRGTLAAAIKGDLPSPSVQFEAKPQVIAFGGFALERPVVTGSYAMGSLCIERLSAGFAGGQAVGKGVVPEGASAEAYFTADLADVHARQVATALGLPADSVSGLFTGKVGCRVTGGRVSCLVEGKARDGFIAGMPFASAEADFRYEAGEVRLNSLVLGDKDSSVTAMGRITTAGSMDLDVTAKKVDVARLAASVAAPGGRELPTTISGFADFIGEVHGSFDSPTLSGMVDISPGEVGTLAFTRLAGQVTASFDGVALNDVGIWQSRSSYRLTGTIIPESTRMDLSVSCDGADVGEMLTLVGLKADVAGSVSGRVTVHGSVGSVSAEGKLAMPRGGTLFGQRVDSADIAFRLSESDLVVDGFAADIGGSTVYAAGSITGGSAAPLRVWARDLDLARLGQIIPRGAAVPLVGRVDFTGMVEGPLSGPSIRGRISSDKASLFEIPYGPIDGEFTYADRVLSTSGLTLRDGQGSVTISGRVDLDNEGLDLTALFDRARLDRLLALARSRFTAPPTSGEVSGEVRLRGAMDDPVGEGSVTVSAARIGSSRLDRIEAAGRLSAGGFAVEKLIATRGSGRLVAHGEGSQGGKLSFEATATGFDIGPFAPVLGLSTSSSGVADLAVKVSGTARSPVGWVTLDVRNGNVGKVAFDRVVASASYERGLLLIETATATQGKHRAEVSGTVPVDPKLLSSLGVSVPESSPAYDLTLVMDPADLSLLSLATSAIRSAEGAGSLVLQVTGPRETPVVQGSVTISKGKVALSGIADPLADVTGAVEFTGEEAVLREVSCKYRGYTITVEGKAAMNGLVVSDVAIAAHTKGLRVEDPRLAATVDADLTLIGPASMPTLGGYVRVSKASFGLAALGAGSLPPADLRLDLYVELGNDTGIRAADIDVDLRGGVRLSGTAKEPQAEGRIEARRGHINYLGTEFRVDEASAEFESPRGIIPTLDVTASTTVSNTRIYLSFVGKATEPVMDVYSVPAMSREEILVLLDYPEALNKLLHGDVEGILKDELVSMLDRQVRFQVVSGIERAFKEALSLDEFRLERGEGEEMVLRIGKLWDKLYLSYATTIGPYEPDATLKFEYLYSPYLFLGGSLDEQGGFSLGAEARFRF